MTMVHAANGVDSGASLDWYVGGAGFSGSQRSGYAGLWLGTVLPFGILD